jgi:threonine dehydratase
VIDLVHIDEIVAAQTRLQSVVRPTRATMAESLSRVVGRPVVVKPEHLQRTGSFKIRGAYNFIAQLPAGVPVVAASAGNHAQGVALAAALTGHPSRIYMPRLASLPKLAATRGYGAEVIQVDGGVDDCMVAAIDDSSQTGAVVVPPFDDRHVIAGQGTIGLEIADEVPDAEVVVVPIGGGGLIAGVAAAIAAWRRGVRVIGVEAEGAASMSASMAAGHPVQVTPSTMADGVALRAPGALPLAICRSLVDEVVQVSDEQISTAVVMLIERVKAVVEPSGAMAIAAILAGAIPGSGPAVAVCSGGNVDSLLLARLIDHGLAAAGRFQVLRVVIGDQPGTLHTLTGVIASAGANLLTVEHHREGQGLPIASVAVTLTIETRDHAHQLDVVDALAAAGYAVSEHR